MLGLSSAAFLAPRTPNSLIHEARFRSTSLKFFGGLNKKKAVVEPENPKSAKNKDVKNKKPVKSNAKNASIKNDKCKNPRMIALFGKPEWDWTKNQPVAEDSWQKTKRVDWLNR